MKSARIWLLAGVGIAILLTVFLVWRAKPREVDVAQPRFGPAVEMIYATGYVEVEQPVSVAARVTAPVVKILVDEGDAVRRGQPLLLLEDAEQKGLLAQASAQRRASVLDEQRTVALFAKGWVTKAARDRAVAEAATARAAERSSRARVDQQVVRAGIDGIVLKRDVEPGDLAVPSRTLLLLGNPARIRVTATVDERDVPRLHIGQTALMASDAWPNRIIRGRLTEITPSGDPTQRAFRIRLGLDEGSDLPMGMTLEVNVVTQQVDRALLVPASSVVDGKAWVVEADKAERRPVKTGIVATDDVQIVSGLSAQERIIRNPPADLAEGERVKARAAK